MLDTLRRGTGTWIAKIFIGLLVLSFAVWGIADIFGGFGGRAVATVGEVEVSAQEYQLAFQTEVQLAGRQLGRNLGLEEARTLGLQNQVLGRLVGDATLTNDALERGFGMSREALARAIVRDPTFRDSTGQFSRVTFEQFLAFNGLNEPTYVAMRKEGEMRQQLANALTAGGTAPKALLDAANAYQNESRTISYFVIPSSAVADIGDPPEAELKAYFEDNKQRFAAPEYRRVELIQATPDTVLDRVEVEEQDIRDAYDFRKAEFGRPERREIAQVVFGTTAEANEARGRILSGTPFAEIARERGLSESDMSLGLVEKSEIFDLNVQEAAFSLPEGGLSEPIEGALGVALVKVRKIERESVKPYEEVREQVRLDLAREQAGNVVLDVFDQVEDDRAAGLTFAEIAAKNKLPYQTLSALDAQGRDDNGERRNDVPLLDEMTQLAFDTDPGVEVDPLQLGDNGFLWVNVAGITSERERSLEEVRFEVSQAWRRQKLNEAYAAKASELTAQIASGMSLEEAAASVGAEVATTAPIKRSVSHDVLSTAAVTTAFASAQGKVASSTAARGSSRVVLRVDSVSVPPVDLQDQDTQAISDSLDQTLMVDLINAYVAAKQQAFGVSINRQLFGALTGEGQRAF